MQKCSRHIICLILAVYPLFGAVSINEKRPYELVVRESGPAEVILEYSIADISMSAVELTGKTFTEVKIPGALIYHAVGTPQLPFIRKLIKVPENSHIETNVIVHSEELIDLSAAGYPDPIVPVQPYRRKSDQRREPLAIDEAIYQAAEYYTPATTDVHTPFNLGGIRAVALDFFPVSYNPVEHNLKVISEATITVRIIGEPVLRKALRKPVIHPEIEQIVRKALINYDEPEIPEKIMAYPNLLVIAGDRFRDNPDLKAWLGWKRQCGFDVVLRSAADFGGTAESIKDSIFDRFQSGVPLTHVLLVGDVAEVPTWTGPAGRTETDAPYVRMDDDYIPDLMIGRFSAADDADLAAMIQKSLAYERCNVSNIGAFNQVTFIASNDVDFWEIAEASHDYVINNHLNNHGIGSTHLKGHSGAGTADIIQALNMGSTICHYSGHGLVDQWQGPQFLNGNIRDISSGAMPTLVISNACLTGSYAEAECFGETWIRTAERGAVAFIGASNSTHWEPDDLMERAMYDGYFRDGEISIGGMLYRGLLDVYIAMSSVNDTSTFQYYYDVYNILGDPSLKPRMGMPTQTMVSYRPVVEITDEQFTISVMDENGWLENAVVTLVQQDRLVARGKTGGDGLLVLSVENCLLQMGDILLTVTHDKQIPLIDTLTVISPLNIAVEPASVTVGQEALVTVTVQDENANPVEGAEIILAGWTVGSDSLLGMTDSTGLLEFYFRPKYGENLLISGHMPGETHSTFIETLAVSGAMSFTNPGISAGAAQFGIDEYLIPNQAGQIRGFADQGDYWLAARGCGVDTFSVGSSLEVIPNTVGQLQTALLKAGYEVYERSITVQKAYGSLVCYVHDADLAPLEEVRISGYRLPDTLNPIFYGITGSNGEFRNNPLLEVGYYRLAAEKFGYFDLVLEDTIKADLNHLEVEMSASPRITVSGRVTGGIVQRPLDAVLTIDEFSTGRAKYYTSMEVHVSANGYYEVGLPSGEFEFTASSMRFISRTVPVSIGDQALELNFQLDTTRASILVIDDDSGKRSTERVSSYTVAEKAGKGASAATMDSLLEAAGYFIFRTTYTSGLYGVLNDYDLVISSSGSNVDPVFSSGYRAFLESYVAGGGRLLIEGGEVGYDAVKSPGYHDFAANILHISSWQKDQAGPLFQLMADHELTTSPEQLPFQYDINYTGYGDEDACVPTADAAILYYNLRTTYAGIILYEDPVNPWGSRIVFYTFAFDKLLDPEGRRQLLENTVAYLLREPLHVKGDLNRDGTINILDLTRLVNIILQTAKEIDEIEFWSADLNGDNVVNILDLVWTINIILGKEGFAKPTGSGSGYLEFSSRDKQLTYNCSEAVAALQIEFESGCPLELAEYFENSTDISIKQQNNILLLYSQTGVALLSGSGILGRIDDPEKIVSILAVSLSGEAVQVEVNSIPGKFQLYQNYPNPFNAATVFRFDLPREEQVSLEIYDVLGRRVATLIHENKKPGRYECCWDGQNSLRQDLASGIYFYSLRAGDFLQIRKLMLMK